MLRQSRRTPAGAIRAPAAAPTRMRASRAPRRRPSIVAAGRSARPRRAAPARATLRGSSSSSRSRPVAAASASVSRAHAARAAAGTSAGLRAAADARRRRLRAADQASLGSLPGRELRERRPHAQPVDVAGEQARRAAGATASSVASSPSRRRSRLPSDSSASSFRGLRTRSRSGAAPPAPETRRASERPRRRRPGCRTPRPRAEAHEPASVQRNAPLVAGRVSSSTPELAAELDGPRLARDERVGARRAAPGRRPRSTGASRRPDWSASSDGDVERRRGRPVA